MYLVATPFTLAINVSNVLLSTTEVPEKTCRGANEGGVGGCHTPQ